MPAEARGRDVSQAPYKQDIFTACRLDFTEVSVVHSLCLWEGRCYEHTVVMLLYVTGKRTLHTSALTGVTRKAFLFTLSIGCTQRTGEKGNDIKYNLI